MPRRGDQQLCTRAEILRHLSDDDNTHEILFIKAQISGLVSHSNGDSSLEPFTDVTEELFNEIQIPLEGVLAMLIDDCIGPSIPGGDNEATEGVLFQHSTIEVYVAAVMELRQAHTCARSHRHPTSRTNAVTSLITQRRCNRAQTARGAAKAVDIQPKNSKCQLDS